MTTSTSAPRAEGTPAEILARRIADRTAVVAIVGLGYVGLPLCRAVHASGFEVLGFDCDAEKIDALTQGRTYLTHLGDDLVPTLAASDRFRATTDAATLESADVILLCVPTPLGPHREPDLSYVVNSTRMIASVLRPAQLVVLESTTYPGTTRDVMRPILEATDLCCGTDFFLAYSPEREDPGRPGVTTTSIPKLVGGVDDASSELARAFYEPVIDCVHVVSRAAVAEAAKLLENVYRAVDIALVNELKVLFDRMDLDVWEVIEAASTKPFGFQPFFPGPGLGGHCIPIDPFYLAWKAKELGHTTKFIELAGEINAQMPVYVVSKLIDALNTDRLSLRGVRVLVAGIAYKKNVDDIRESPAAEIIELLRAGGADVDYHDPHITVFPSMRRYQIDLESVPLTAEVIGSYDAVIIVTDHDAVDYALIGRAAKVVIDTRNAMERCGEVRVRVVKA